MPLRRYKALTPGRRQMTVSTFEEITKTKPEKSLTTKLQYHAGRNSSGRVTSRFRGGRVKRLYRIIDFKRNKIGIPARVASIEYDPYRSARIALLYYKDGEKKYIIAPNGLKVNDTVMSGENSEIKPGNALPLSAIPQGVTIHNIEMKPGKGAQIARSAGTSATLVAKEGKYAQVMLPSGEVRMILIRCFATIGQVGNIDHELITIGKAGRNRWLGKKPHVRGVVMNPVDHPHGGGEGKSAQGNPHPVTPWGKPTKGYRTRNKKKLSSKYIIKRRK